MKIREIIQTLFPTRTWKLAAIIAGGILCGLGSYTLYASRAWTYLSDDPATCVNCHIMGPYYATWNHSSHSRNATCNDCHVPHENAVKKWFFKGMDGMRHASVFMMRGEPQVIQAIDESAEVIMNNCIRCHTQLNTEFVNTGRIDHEMAMEKGKLAGIAIARCRTEVRTACLLHRMRWCLIRSPYRRTG